MNEANLIQKAKEYLKTEYGEDTIRMDVQQNGVVHGSGVLEVDCTVNIDGSHSDWTKWFTFKAGEVTNMRWRAH